MEMKTATETRESPLTPEQFAHLGDGLIAYVRSMRSEDVNRLYPQAPQIAPGLTIFALFGADGAPIVLADSEEGCIGNARENHLQMVSLH
ncbi:DUF1150 domain-containing protein [Methylocystis sp. L43]|jgi:hypothetical protein|uniref:BQ00720 family protein n=1 Tax=Methylocystis TaxID=133 RepID=UPI0018C2F6CE|nr:MULTISPECIES: DUF1150 domain-containing protein [Methylocystis]MBG0796513.1 DUF1150 domain-containing protein [Methylocystis sp. L43]MBG0804451.1 DUF1150 domain-containing protein [Methylocystis sp. H15]MCQ4190874.1 DUF1150 domain-containing protein [Methylocystis suflitae]